MHFKVHIMFVILPLIAHCQQTSKFLNSESFAEYPPWVVVSQGLLKLSFRTSESDGLLLYMDDGFTNGNFFRTRLLNGVLNIDLLGNDFSTLPQPVAEVLGEHLNDNCLHNVSVRQDHTNAQFMISLDNLAPVTMTYREFETTSSLFVGGISSSLRPATSNVTDDPHFVGCLVDIQYSNTSTVIEQLEYILPITDKNVVNNLGENCVDPCEGVSCGSGVCIARWPTGFCDCRGTNMLGESCTEDPSLHMRSFTDGAPYLCYDARLQPYRATPTTASIRLISPLPQSGTIMTGYFANRIQFSISLRNREIVYELIVNRNSTVLLTSQNALSTDSSYQLEYTLTDNFTSISIGRFSGDSLSPLETMSELIAPTLGITDTHFQGVCLGGAVLEDISYSGTLKNVYFNHLSLTEERYFNLFKATSTSRSDVINFSDLLSPSSLLFTTRDLNESRLSFDVRTDPGGLGTLLSSEDKFNLIIFNDGVLFFPLDDECCNATVNDGQWHHVDVNIIKGSSPGIGYTIDSVECPSVSVDMITLQDLLNKPLQFGAPVIFTDGDLPSDRFQGCFQNIIYEYESGETFRPNLEAVARTEERFSTTGCFGCSSDQEAMAACINGGVCEYRSNKVGGECLCSEDYAGSQCESFVTPSPTPSTLTSMPFPSTTAPTLTSMPTPTVNPAPTGLEVGAFIGIGIAILIGLLLLILLIILIVVVCWSRGGGGQGFYRTYETNEKSVSVVRYSASLRELTSEVVSSVKSNGEIPQTVVQSNGGHDKEFYL